MNITEEYINKGGNFWIAKYGETLIGTIGIMPYGTERAHKFYEKAGFREVKEDDLPIKFSHPYKDCDFFLLEL